MNYKSINYLLTGATGVVGSHILFELIRKALGEDLAVKIYLVVRDNKISAEKRVLQILTSAARPSFLRKYTLDRILDLVEVISSDIQSLTTKLLESLPPNLIVIHCASSTNLQKTQLANAETKNEIVENTRHLLAITQNHTNTFVYISTAFSCGIQPDETITENYSKSTPSSYRNFYEQYKNEAELLVSEQCVANNIAWKILRPSIVCGRLIDPPFFEIPKYDVFYSWAIFLHKYCSHCNDGFRIHIDINSGLNIVPVDFVAKCVVYTLDAPFIQELNIVNPKKVLHSCYIGKVLEYFDIYNYKYIEFSPLDLNRFENIYYKTVGALFEDYIAIPDIKYDTTAIENVAGALSIPIDLKVEEHFMSLIEHAVKNNFIQTY